VGASRGPIEPTAASTTTRGQVHDRASTEVAVQTVAAVKGNEAGGGKAVVEETAQGVALEEEGAEEAAAMASVSVNVSGGGMKTASRDDEKAQMNWRSTIGSGITQASTNDVKTQMNWRPTIGSGNTHVSADDEKIQMNWWPTIGSGNTPASGGQRSRVGAVCGPMKPTAASTTTRGQVHEGASTEVAVQTVSAAKGSEAGGGGTAEVEETAQGVASEEEDAEEETRWRAVR
jgi:hypothetical protein